ncbi:MAG TPA: hypothetical protein PKA53_04950 [Sphingobacterium sp.]|nr:hypothetical protein [Sphingobacterium sp.]
MDIVRGHWVGHRTVFYHELTGACGTNINDVIDYGNLELDSLGLAAYLDYGYCVFAHTPVKHVKFLLPHQSLIVLDGKVRVEDQPDSTLALLNQSAHEDDVLSMIEQHVNDWASSFDDDILIPTSGGFDSRLLNVVLKDKERIRAYTYGTSNDQNSSREVVYAQQLSRRLGTVWKRIDLGRFNSYQDDWFALFGCSVGAVGTYHLEFFDKIHKLEGQREMHMLSGIIGDAWAGAVYVKPVNDVKEYKILGHTHQMTANSQQATGVDYRGLVEQVFDKQKDLLQDPKYRILTAMRTKMMLLQSLISVPEYYRYTGYSPFLGENIAMSMLNIPDERRANRVWQRDYFRRHNVLFEEEKHSFTYQNSLNYYALINHEIEPLDVRVLREAIHVEYINWINDQLQHIGRTQRIFQNLMHTPKVKGALKSLGFKNKLMEAYFAYTTLKPIEKLLKKRNDCISNP